MDNLLTIFTIIIAIVVFGILWHLLSFTINLPRVFSSCYTTVRAPFKFVRNRARLLQLFSSYTTILPPSTPWSFQRMVDIPFFTVLCRMLLVLAFFFHFMLFDTALFQGDYIDFGPLFPYAIHISMDRCFVAVDTPFFIFFK